MALLPCSATATQGRSPISVVVPVVLLAVLLSSQSPSAAGAFAVGPNAWGAISHRQRNGSRRWMGLNSIVAPDQSYATEPADVRRHRQHLRCRGNQGLQPDRRREREAGVVVQCMQNNLKERRGTG
eukprot:TRINITY_DN7896_c0_g1_i1.p1 TRINITY_DN7896_c0_g1~~TRINITY_DN7896_c0_g1_i1.p1  ORF type:complete len:138 (+),score=5.07 TRINITY_DN7896_c0_g1_i1:39-416(+)